jgi:hypothetical protein
MSQTSCRFSCLVNVVFCSFFLNNDMKCNTMFLVERTEAGGSIECVLVQVAQEATDRSIFQDYRSLFSKHLKVRHLDFFK